ncbi:Calponin-3 [Nymphon striatum]|nr:Calponin-3 [Nymphon striatum]
MKINCEGRQERLQLRNINAFAKFDMDKAMTCLQWIQELTQLKIEPPDKSGFKDQIDFSVALMDGLALCSLMNVLEPGSVPNINKGMAIFKQEFIRNSVKANAEIYTRENIEFFLKACEKYGLKSHDLFQVNDLYEKKNPYTVVNCLYALGGLAQKKGFDGPTIGVKVSNKNVRQFSSEKLLQGKSVIGLQSGTNRGASQSGMTAYGTGRQIIPDGSLN